MCILEFIDFIYEVYVEGIFLKLLLFWVVVFIGGMNMFCGCR